jgi:hypothetical protein
MEKLVVPKSICNYYYFSKYWGIMTEDRIVEVGRGNAEVGRGAQGELSVVA